MTDIAATALAVTNLLAPFTPYLLEAGKAAGTKLAETIGEQGGDTAWKTAQNLWAKITGRFSHHEDLNDAAQALATKPTSERHRKTLAEVLAEQLQHDPTFATELEALLGGNAAVQQIVGGNEAQIRNVQQKLAGGFGTQTVKGGDGAVIDGVTQEQQG